MLKQILLLALVIPSLSFAAPQQFKDITSLMNEYNDYSPDIGDFKVLSANPLKIQISPKVMSGETDESIRMASYKASVYAAYRTLLQTPAKSVSITVVPLSFDLSNHKKTYLTGKQYSFSLTKEQALKKAGRAGGTNNPDEIIGSDGYEWTNSFNSCCYLEAGNPGLEKFVKELIK